MKTTTMLAALAALACAASPAAGQNPGHKLGQVCDCKDLRDMKNRVCEARQAIRELTRLEQMYYDEETKTKTVVYLDGDSKAQVKACLKEAMGTATDEGSQNATGETNASCAIESVTAAHTYMPVSMCMTESVNLHEGYHTAQCKLREQDKWVEVFTGTPSALIDTRYSQSVVSYMAEERMAYAMEEIRLRLHMQEIMAKCKPAETSVKAKSDDEVPGRKKGDTYQLDLSKEGCPSRPRPPKGTSACKKL